MDGQIERQIGRVNLMEKMYESNWMVELDHSNRTVILDKSNRTPRTKMDGLILMAMGQSERAESIQDCTEAPKWTLKALVLSGGSKNNDQKTNDRPLWTRCKINVK